MADAHENIERNISATQPDLKHFIDCRPVRVKKAEIGSSQIFDVLKALPANEAYKRAVVTVAGAMDFLIRKDDECLNAVGRRFVAALCSVERQRGKFKQTIVGRLYRQRRPTPRGREAQNVKDRSYS